MVTGNDTALRQAVRVLNEAFRADPAAVHALICNRVPCNETLADHPTIVVSSVRTSAGGEHYNVGPLGILNGVLGTDHLAIGSMWSDPAAEGEREFMGFTVIDRAGSRAMPRLLNSSFKLRDAYRKLGVVKLIKRQVVRMGRLTTAENPAISELLLEVMQGVTEEKVGDFVTQCAFCFKAIWMRDSWSPGDEAICSECNTEATGRVSAPSLDPTKHLPPESAES